MYSTCSDHIPLLSKTLIIFNFYPKMTQLHCTTCSVFLIWSYSTGYYPALSTTIQYYPVTIWSYSIGYYHPASAWHTSIFCVWGPVATQQGKPSQILSRVDHQEKIITQLGDKRPQDKPSNYTLSKNAKSADLGVLVVVVGTRGENIGGPIVSMRNGGCDMSMRRALSCFQFMIRSLKCLQHAFHNISHKIAGEMRSNLNLSQTEHMFIHQRSLSPFKTNMIAFLQWF